MIRLISTEDEYIPSTRYCDASPLLGNRDHCNIIRKFLDSIFSILPVFIEQWDIQYIYMGLLFWKMYPGLYSRWILHTVSITNRCHYLNAV